MSRDALRFVERHGPSEFQREPYAAELLGLITPDLLDRYRDPCSREAWENMAIDVIRKMNDNKVRQRALVQTTGRHYLTPSNAI